MHLGLDHVGIAAFHLDGLRLEFERLGFNLTQKSVHAGADPETGAVVPWGSGNHCAMFADGGYLELLGLVDESRPSNVIHMVRQYEGLHIVALRCASADATYAQALQSGIAADAPARLERDAVFGAQGDQTRRARFNNVYLDRVRHPEARFILIEHLTPDVLWQPHLLGHANGCRALLSTYLCPPSVDDTVERLRPLLGEPAWHGQRAAFALAHGTLWVMNEHSFRALLPHDAGPRVQRVAAATFGVESLEQLRAFFAAQAISYSEGTTADDAGPCLWVAPHGAQPCHLQFVPI